MQMYVNYCDRFIKLPEENKTIGIILCQKKSELLMEVTLPENNKQIFAFNENISFHQPCYAP